MYIQLSGNAERRDVIIPKRRDYRRFGIISRFEMDPLGWDLLLGYAVGIGFAVGIGYGDGMDIG